MTQKIEMLSVAAKRFLRFGPKSLILLAAWAIFCSGCSSILGLRRDLGDRNLGVVADLSGPSFGTEYASRGLARPSCRRLWSCTIPLVIPSWYDMVEGSHFLKELHQTELSSNLKFYLLFGFRCDPIHVSCFVVSVRTWGFYKKLHPTNYNHWSFNFRCGR